MKGKKKAILYQKHFPDFNDVLFCLCQGIRKSLFQFPLVYIFPFRIFYILKWRKKEFSQFSVPKLLSL